MLTKFPSSADPGRGSGRIPNLLDRLKTQSSPTLSESQAFADQIVSSVVTEATRGSMLLAMVGAGWAFRMTRVGILSSVAVPEGSTVLPVLLRGGSYGAALASESAVFAGIEGGLRRLEGEPSPHHYKDEWARAAINLSALRLMMGAAGNQNLIFQHFMTDLSMVGGQQLGHAFGLTPKPQGSFAQQMAQAEGMNWSMKAGMTLLHGLSPQLSVQERSWDLYLRSREGNLFPSSQFTSPFSRPLLSAAEGGPFIFSEGLKSPEGLKGPRILMMSGEQGGGGEPPLGPRDTASDHITIPNARNLLGSVIEGRYFVDDVLGFGGMGVVYECTHQTLGKKFAMKVLRADLSRDPGVTQRFLNEAKAASTIGNPHIIEVSDFGSLPDGSTFFVMEYLKGMPLSHLVAGEKPAPSSRIVPIARQMAEGLAAAHKAGIVHRDLKPDNIFLTERGTEKDFVKILDFGIAKVATGGPTKLTRAGEVFGTPEYMSPEQAKGDASVDQRSDVYSFGIILYELATGKIPFNSENPMSILNMQISKQPPPLRELAPPTQEIPPGLEAIIMKSLSKKPSDRYQSMEEVMAELDKLKTGETPAAVSEMRVRSWKRHLPIFLGVAGAGGASALIAAFLFSKPSEGPPRPPPPLPDVLPVTPTPPTPPDQTPKRVELTVEPDDAHIFQGDQDLGKGPVTIEVGAGATLELEVRREGFKTKVISLDGSQEKRTIRLEKDPTAPTPTRPKPKPPKPPPPKPNPSNPNDLESPWKWKRP